MCSLQVQKPTDDPVNFTESNNKNVFGLEPNEKIVPGSEFVATMQIENNSDVAFGYWVKIVCEDEDVAKKLAKTMCSKTSAFITIFSGEGSNENTDSMIAEVFKAAAPNAEINCVAGNHSAVSTVVEKATYVVFLQDLDYFMMVLIGKLFTV